MKSRRAAVLAVLVTAVLVITATGGFGIVRGDDARTHEHAARTTYERAVIRMVNANHLLERRQAALFYAARRAARADEIAVLRREVKALERDYNDAIVAMARVFALAALAQKDNRTSSRPGSGPSGSRAERAGLRAAPASEGKDAYIGAF